MVSWDLVIFYRRAYLYVVTSDCLIQKLEGIQKARSSGEEALPLTTPTSQLTFWRVRMSCPSSVAKKIKNSSCNIKACS